MPKCIRGGGPVRLLVGLVLVACLVSPARALHEESPAAYRITTGVSHFHSPGRAWGNYLAFSSTEDLTNTGNATRQIFVFNMADFDCFNGTTKPTTPCPSPLRPFLTQATNGPGDPDNPSISATFDTNGDGTDDAQWLAFDALGTFNGGIGAVASHRQIFLKNLFSNEIRQLTFGTDGDSVRPTLSSQGGLVVFETTARLVSPSSTPVPAGISQIYAYETNNRLLKQITAGLGPSTNATTNESGGIIGFQSSANLLGDRADTGITQIFWAEYDRRNHIATLQQLTHGNAPSMNPGLSAVASFMVFDSTATDLPGTLGGAGSSVYMTTRLGNPNEQPPTLIQLTDPAVFGSCVNPVVNAGTVGDHIGFVCTGDPLQNLTTGNRLFVWERSTLKLYQITGAGSVQPPIGMNIGTWFVTLSTTSDLTTQGACGYQLYVIDYFPGRWNAATQRGELPPDAVNPNDTSVIGARQFEMLPGDALGGSQMLGTTRDRSSVGLVGPDGALGLVVGAPNEFTREASIRVRQDRSKFPPALMPTGTGFGAVCFSLVADGEGTIDCDGGRAGIDVIITQDHDTSDSDPLCLAPGCRENDATCQGGLRGPHSSLCPICFLGNPPAANGVCDGGLHDGEPCSTDLACEAGLPCEHGTMSTCNGPEVTELGGTFAPGGALLSVPVKLSLPVDPGLDGKYCTADDRNSAVSDVPITLRLTTGTATSTTIDADALLGTTLVVTETGAPFDCARLRAGDLTGTRLVGVVPLLDVPNLPALRDLVVSVRLDAEPPPTSGCNGNPPCLASTDCDDGNPCNGVESCASNFCTTGTAINCDDGNPCNGTEVCDPANGTCNPGPPCDDGNPCNGVETCDLVNGCQPGTAITCSDNDACNGLETCDPGTGACQPASPLNCDDGEPCTTDTCVPAQGCVHTVLTGTCDDGSLCTTADTCVAGVCVGTSVVCDNGNPCDGVETCDPPTGSCLPGTPPTCNDGNPCTDDSCDSTFGCLYANNTSSCDDGNACTSSETCQNGLCTGLPLLCDDGDMCNGVETCDPQSGLCQAGAPPACGDGNPCTDDSCDAQLGCLYSNNTNPCDDGSVCTSSDTCLNGLCGGTPVVCNDNDMCNGVETCDPVNGCQPGTPTVCNDGNPCTDDSCDAVLGCLYSNNTSSCDDGNACTGGDTCQAGVCGGAPFFCDDGDACNGVETCDPQSGLCQPGTPTVCNDGNPCTDDVCDPGLGCLYTNNTAPCDDGVTCTTGDVCSAGLCSGTPDPLCQLDVLRSQVRGLSAADLGGGRRQRQLYRRLAVVRKKITAALANPAQRATKLKAAQRLLASFILNVRKAAHGGKIEVAIAERLLSSAKDLDRELSSSP